MIRNRLAEILKILHFEDKTYHDETGETQKMYKYEQYVKSKQIEWALKFLFRCYNGIFVPNGKLLRQNKSHQG